MKFRFLLITILLNNTFIYSQTIANDSMVTIVYIRKIKVSYDSIVGKYNTINKPKNLIMIDTLKVNPGTYVFVNPLKRDYQQGEVLFLLEKRNFFYHFLDRLVYTKKELSKLFVDEDFKRKLLNYGINLDEIDPKLIVNNSL
jgi:hypothetical protein